jgi:hypothetical protein
MVSKKDTSWIARGLRAGEGVMAVKVEVVEVGLREERRPADVIGRAEIGNIDARG